VGILTEGDMLRRTELGTELRHSRLLEFMMSRGKLAQEYTRSHARKVSEVMTHAAHLRLSPQLWLSPRTRVLGLRNCQRGYGGPTSTASVRDSLNNP